MMYNSTIAILYNVYERHSDEKTRLRISTSLAVLCVLINVTIIALRLVVVAELTNLLNKTNKSYPYSLVTIIKALINSHQRLIRLPLSYM